MNRLWIIFFAGWMPHSLLADSYESIKINEFMASNIYTQLNPDDSDFDDWIELYNAGDRSMSLSGHFLSDDFSSPFKWQLPPNAIIPSKAFFIILCLASWRLQWSTICTLSRMRIQANVHKIYPLNNVWHSIIVHKNVSI